MLEILKNRLKNFSGSHHHKLDYIREYLQLLMLRIIDEKGYFKDIAFVGGTALRILYDLKRFSEDLDFSIIQPDFSFKKMLETLLKELKLENLNIEFKYKDEKTVAWAMIKFNDLLHGLDLSLHKNEKFFIKIEIDKNPPKGYVTEFSVINKEFLIGINHYDLSSLFAGKLHAILCRKYTKGRDFYDLIWYLTRDIIPNYTLLNNVINQTNKNSISLDKQSLKELLEEKIINTDFKTVLNDVSPFLIESKESRFFNVDTFLKLIQQL